MKMKKSYYIFCICIITLTSCKKEKDKQNDNTDNSKSSIVINYNDNQSYTQTDLPDSCAIYNTKKHIVTIETSDFACYGGIIMNICINLDSIKYPFMFPKKNIVFQDYIFDNALVGSDCASFTFYKIVSPDTLISDFQFISADKKSKFILTEYANNYIKGQFSGTIYCFKKHHECEYLPIDNSILLDSMTVNNATFNLKLIKE